MRRTVIALNSIVAVFFIGFLAYTFVARQHLDGLARRFVTEKTVQYSKPIVDLAEASLDAQLVHKLLPAAHKAAVRQEIADYREDPAHYIADLTRDSRVALKPVQANPLLAKVAAIKEGIRTFYDDTLNALIDDLRIFSICNLTAAVIALGLVLTSRKKVPQSVVWFSFLMFGTVLYCSLMYVDDLTFFRILFRSHLGWKYAVVLGFVQLMAYQEFGHLGTPPVPPAPASSINEENSKSR